MILNTKYLEEKMTKDKEELEESSTIRNFRIVQSDFDRFLELENVVKETLQERSDKPR